MVDRIGGALGQQWLQRLIQEAVAQNRPTDKRQGAPSSLISTLLGPDTLSGEGLRRTFDPVNQGIAGAVGGLTSPDALSGEGLRRGLSGVNDFIGGLTGQQPATAAAGQANAAPANAPASLFGGGAAPADPNAPSPMLGPEDYAKRITESASAASRQALGLPAVSGAPEATAPSFGGSFTGGGVTPGGLFGIGGGAPNQVQTQTGAGQPRTAIEQITGQPVGGGGGGGGAAGSRSILGATDPNLTSIDAVVELLDNPSFAVQDMLRDRGINPGRNKYAGMMAKRLTPVFGELSALALAQAGVGAATSDADKVAAYNTFINNFMGGKVDKGQLLRTAMAQAEADPGGTMASLIRDMGPEGLAQLIGQLGGQGAMLGQATQRMLGERAMDAKRRQQALAEQGKVTEDDLSFLPSFRGSI